MFVLVAEVFNTFGKIVFDRIKDKSVQVEYDGKVPLPKNFKSFDVPEDSKEICKNWFYKVFFN
jgi:hypothetical protein